MISKLLYFRPDRRYVSEQDLNATYTCTVTDRCISAETTITVPVYLTVVQRNVPKSSKRIRQGQTSEKIVFHLIGSQQIPSGITESPKVSNIDRVEFRGHLGFEKPIFDLIGQLPSLRKVSFYLSPQLQRQFILDKDFDEKSLMDSAKSSLVTNINIFVENFSPENEPCNEDKVKSANIFEMVTRILDRIVSHCPNTKRLTMDVPNGERIKSTVETCMKGFLLLKLSEVICQNGNLLVRKRNEVTPTDEGVVAGNNHAAAKLSSTSQTELDRKSVDLEDRRRSTSSGFSDVESAESSEFLDGQEQQPCLFDMSKRLGSMLGIPTTSLPPATQVAISSPCFTTFQNSAAPQETIETHSSGSVAAIPILSQATSKPSSNQPIHAKRTFNPSAEVITYAAAAASASTTNTTFTNAASSIQRHHNSLGRPGGNENGSYYRKHDNDENSSRQFHIRDGEPSLILEDGRSTSRRKHIPLVADLGKPVFVLASSSNSPHKR